MSSVSPLQIPVVWDGLGLENSHSGIGVHACSLYKELQNKWGLVPFVTKAKNSSVDFVEDSYQIKASFPGAFSWALQAKFIAPQVFYRASTRKFNRLLYHGLSNFNLPHGLLKRPQDLFVLTVHDLIPLLTQRTSKLSVQMSWMLEHAVKSADAVIAISTWTKDLIEERYGHQISSKIHLIENGFDVLTDASTVEKDSDAAEPFVLTVARGESYKRLSLVREIARKLPDIQFLVVTDASGQKQLYHTTKNLRVLVSISSRELHNFYKKARVLLHPSLYEGWCLPASTALMLGCPVVYCEGSGIDDVCKFFPKLSFGLRAEASLDDWIQRIDATFTRKMTLEDKTPTKNPPLWSDQSLKTLNLYQNLLS